MKSLRNKLKKEKKEDLAMNVKSKNRTVLYIIENLKNNMRIWEALYAIFSYLAMGINFQSKYDSIVNIVIFAYTLIATDKRKFFNRNDIEKCKNRDRASDFAYVLNRWKEICDFLKIKECSSIVAEMFETVIANWNALSKLSITYRMLAVLMRVCQPDGGKEAKQALISLLDDSAKEWDREDKTDD